MSTSIGKEFIKASLRLAGYEVRKRSQATAAAPPAPSQAYKTPTYADYVGMSLGQFTSQLERNRIDLVLDVGANSGQFGLDLRNSGFSGQIVSFEPLSAAHAELTRAAAVDPKWTVAPRTAVGASRGETEINIAGNSYSSSLLPMLDRHLEGAPNSAYSGREKCPILCLDDFLDEHFPDHSPIGLKIDTQGYEQFVLQGIERHLDRVKVVVLEMSLTPLYGNAASMEQLHRWLTTRGLVCVGIHPEFIDPQTEELLQVNGLFARILKAAA